VNDAYNHWIGVMQLNEKEYPPLKNIQIQSNKRKDCLKLGSDGIYIYIDKTIYICIQKNNKNEWIFSANKNKDTIKEVVFHEMFHAVQAGIATGAKSNSEDAIPVNPYSTWWIMEGTAAAAGKSGNTWVKSDRHSGKSVNTEFYKIAGTLSEVEKYYEVHDYWIHSLPNIYATKNLFKVNKNKAYTKDDLNYNVQLVTELLGETNPNYIRDNYWKWVKDQALELNKDVLDEKNPCDIYRLATQTEIGYDPRSSSANSVEIDFKAVFIDKDPTAIAKIPKTLPATPLTSRLWNFTFTNVSGQNLIHFNLSSTQPNAKFHIYKLPKDLPAGFTGCQDPAGLQDYREDTPADKPGPRDILVDNNTRIVVLGSNLEYVESANLNLEMSVFDKDEDDKAYSRGEPWLSTFDKEFLGFHAVGEFILTKSTMDNFEVQARYVPGRENSFGQTLEEVSFNGAVSVKVGSDRVGVYASKGRNTCWTDNTCDSNYPTRPQVRLNGQIVMPPNGSAFEYHQVLPDGGEVSWSGDEITITSASRSETVRVRLFADAVGSVEVQVSPERRGNLVGLLGDNNNDKSDDYRLRNGSLLASPLTRDQLYLEWGESWRVDQYESLFDYEDNQNAYSFVNRSFPTRAVSLESLSPTARTAGETACRAAGVVDANAFNSCVIDVALTGNPGWANIAKGLDPGSKHIRVSPLTTTVVTGEKVQLSVDISGALATQNIIWNTNGGSIVGSGALVEFVAPSQAGAYLVSVRSAEDSSLQASIPVEVVEEVQPIGDRFAVGADSAALLNSSGFVSVWGRDLLQNSQPLCSDRGNTLIDGVSQVRSVSTPAYGGFVVANNTNGNLITWGQLAHAVPEFSNTIKPPMVLSPAKHWVGVTASNYSLVSLKRDGTAWYWLPVIVAPYSGLLKPFLITGVSNVVGLSPRALLKGDGTVWQLEGEYNFTDYVARASKVSGLNQVIQVSSSDSNYHYLALKSDGTVWAWGVNDSGQLGLGLTSGVISAPQQIPNLSNVVKVFAGQDKSYALKSDGTLWVWGANDGRIDAAPSVLTSPTQIPNLGQVKDFRASVYGIYVVKQDNSILGWGDNYSQTIKCSSEPADRSILFPTLIPGVNW
jgi:Regulator of chromosome condensation (RCC1) repeat/von Willebrand factor type D domain